jgi:hypothetical protein
MSRYAWLVCEDAREMIWLGKIVTERAVDEVYFHIGDEAAPPNSEKPVLMKAIMRFLAQHMGKVIRVVPEEDLDKVTDETFAEIGNDPALGALMSDYIKRFPG